MVVIKALLFAAAVLSCICCLVLHSPESSNLEETVRDASVSLMLFVSIFFYVYYVYPSRIENP